MIRSETEPTRLVIRLLDARHAPGNTDGAGSWNDVPGPQHSILIRLPPTGLHKIPAAARVAFQQIVNGPIGSPPVLASNVDVISTSYHQIAIVVQHVQGLSHDAINFRLTTYPNANMKTFSLEFACWNFLEASASDQLGEPMENFVTTPVKPNVRFPVVWIDDRSARCSSGDRKLTTPGKILSFCLCR